MEDAEQAGQGRHLAVDDDRHPAAQSPLDAYGLAKLVNPTSVPRFFGSFRDQIDQGHKLQVDTQRDGH